MPMQAMVRCPRCWTYQTLERPITEPGTVHLICHRCEAPIHFEVTAADLAADRPQAWLPTTSTQSGANPS